MKFLSKFHPFNRDSVTTFRVRENNFFIEIQMNEPPMDINITGLLPSSSKTMLATPIILLFYDETTFPF